MQFFLAALGMGAASKVKKAEQKKQTLKPKLVMKGSDMWVAYERRKF